MQGAGSKKESLLKQNELALPSASVSVALIQKHAEFDFTCQQNVNIDR